MLSVLAILFDPLFLMIAIIAVSLGSSKHYVIPFTGVFIGLFAETLALKVTPGYQWGDSFPMYLAAGITQSIMAYFMVRWWCNRKARSRATEVVILEKY